jgi:ribosome-binding protein aMBF1 (putative translation factor)
MTTSTSLSWDIDRLTVTKSDGGKVSVASREVITLDFSAAYPVPESARSLGDFLDEFEALPDVAPHLRQARQEVAEALTKQSGTRLSHLRLAKGLSQGELAELIGTSQSAVSMLERRLQKPGEDTLRNLARVLDVDFNTLMDALSNE